MYHSVSIGDKNTWEDWRLIPASPPSIVLPPVKKNLVDLPGGNGSIDLTRFLNNTPRYGIREGTWEFVITDQTTMTRAQWGSLIASYLHGKRFEKIILEDDPEYYYSGMLEVSAVKPGKSFSGITISYTIDTFKHRITEFNSENKEDLI